VRINKVGKVLLLLVENTAPFLQGLENSVCRNNHTHTHTHTHTHVAAEWFLPSRNYRVYMAVSFLVDRQSFLFISY
jgi:hypothetical protein